VWVALGDTTGGLDLGFDPDYTGLLISHTPVPKLSVGGGKTIANAPTKIARQQALMRTGLDGKRDVGGAAVVLHRHSFLHVISRDSVLSRHLRAARQ
jgi:hypothetical protein